VVDRSVLELVRRYLDRVADAGIPVVAGVVFGSFARGEQGPDSDIDLLVLSPSFDDGVDFDAANELCRLTRGVDSRIEPHAVGVREFEDDEASPLIGIARQEGIVVTLPVSRTESTGEAPVARVAEARAVYAVREPKGRSARKRRKK
jgi:predicted nucleotidyltransferase